MDAFGDDSDFTSVPATGEAVPSDPAADFLAREQAELGEDLGQELGLESSTTPQVVLDEVSKNFEYICNNNHFNIVRYLTEMIS